MNIVFIIGLYVSFNQISLPFLLAYVSLYGFHFLQW